MINKICIIKTVVCSYFKVSENEIQKLIEDKRKRDLILLLMKKFDCLEWYKDEENKFILKGRLKNKVNKAEEKMLINREFREIYYLLVNEIDRMLK